MTNITLSVNDELKKKMERFSEINWSAVVRKVLEEKMLQLEIKEEFKREFKRNSDFTDWAIEIGRKAKQGMAERLKKEGHIK